METLIANLTGTIQKRKLNNKEYWIAPVTLIVPGVLNGSKGPLLYPEEEIENSVDSWNHIPVVVYHPTLNGQSVSARDPDILDKYGIGFIFNAKADPSLKAELWIDPEAAKRIDNRVLESLEQGNPMEVSTGLFTENERAEEGAVHNGSGRPYSFVARNYRPDHLAVLPDQVGACSLQDGCGMLVNANTEQQCRIDKSCDEWLTSNELSHSDLHDMLSKQLAAKFTQDEPGAWIVEVFDSFLVYRQGEDLFKLSYIKSDGNVTLSSESAQKVVRETSFIPVTNHEEVSPMADSALVNELVTNCACNEEDAKVLNGLSDETLKKIIENNKQKEKAEAVANSAVEELQKTHTLNEETGAWELKKEEPVKEEEVTNESSKSKTEAEWLQEAPESIRNMIQNNMRAEAERRNALYEQIVANEETDEAKKELHQALDLDGMTENGLKALADRLAKKQEKQESFRPSYFGQSGATPDPVSNQQGEEEEDLKAPIINWTECVKEMSSASN